jgi:hypothetical protein
MAFGGSMRRKSAKAGTGGTCIVLWIPVALLSTFGFPLSGTRLGPNISSKKALQSRGRPRPRIITVDDNPSYPKVIADYHHEQQRRSR